MLASLKYIVVRDILRQHALACAPLIFFSLAHPLQGVKVQTCQVTMTAKIIAISEACNNIVTILPQPPGPLVPVLPWSLRKDPIGCV